VIDEHTLRIASTPGYGSRGERISYEFADDGSVTSVRAGSGTTALPFEAYRAALHGRDRVGPGDPIRP